jgi:hypothetical protein
MVILLVLLITNIGGLGALYGYLIRGLLAYADATPILEVVWAAAVVYEVIALGIELNRLARARDSAGPAHT